MRRVFKYVIPVDDQIHDFEMTDTHICGVGSQGAIDEVVLWVENDDTQPLVTRRFTVHGTGHPIPDNRIYVGTVNLAPVPLVWHLYEVFE